MKKKFRWDIFNWTAGGMKNRSMITTENRLRIIRTLRCHLVRGTAMEASCRTQQTHFYFRMAWLISGSN